MPETKRNLSVRLESTPRRLPRALIYNKFSSAAPGSRMEKLISILSTISHSMHRVLFGIGILSGFAISAVAQSPPSDESSDDDSSDPPVVAASTPRPTPAPVRVAPPPAVPQAGCWQMVRLDYPNSDVQDVLRLYGTLTNKKMVMDNFVTGKVTITIPNAVPKEEAIRIIEINLLLNGYSLVPAEGDIVKVVGTGKNPRGTGVPIISDESEIPAGDHIISFLFKLRYADPQELVQALGQYLSPPSTYTSFMALPMAGAILITENSSVIRTLARIINQVDTPPAEVVSEFIKLERADASKVVDLLKDVFEKGDKAIQPGPPGYNGVRNVRAPAGVPQPVQNDTDVGALTALTEESVIVGKIKIAADVRTNRIHVITRPVNMPFVRKLIAEFDANVEFAKPVTRPLRYISAGDALPVLGQALTEPGTPGQGGAEGAAPGATPGATPRSATPTAGANQYGAI